MDTIISVSAPLFKVPPRDAYEDAALLDVRSQFFERGLGELGTRVVRILTKQRDGNEHRPAVRNAGLCGDRCPARGRSGVPPGGGPTSHLRARHS